MSVIREVLSSNPLWMLVRAIDSWCRKMLLGTAWINEPGVVMMTNMRTGALEPFHYTDWRERSLFRGKAYRSIEHIYGMPVYTEAHKP